MSHTVEEVKTKKRTFEWGIPLVAFCISGWIVAGYFAFSPGYKDMMYNLPPGTVLNVVSPTLYLYIALITNVIAWMIAAMFYIRGDEE